jgi:hypothetical protein
LVHVRCFLRSGSVGLTTSDGARALACSGNAEAAETSPRSCHHIAVDRSGGLTALS